MDRDRWTVCIISILCFFIFTFSPVRRMGDSKYCLLVSQSLLEYGTFDIGEYSLFQSGPNSPEKRFTNAVSARKALPYQLERHRKRLYYYFPPGSSLLSVPAVALSLVFHKAPADASDVYSEKNERELQHLLASILMAGLAGVFYSTARLFVNYGSAIALTIAGTLGTPVWSTASRGLPSHTWGIFLLSIVVFVLCKQTLDASSRKYQGPLIATLLAWSYFVRPTFALSIIGITIYYVFVLRRPALAYLVVGAAWFIAFLLYSYYNYDQLLPNYYLPGRIQFTLDAAFFSALAGNLISPSRGLFIFIPTLLVAVFFLMSNWAFVSHRGLLVLAIAIIIGHIALVSSFKQWWGGYSYGPRLLLDILPWLFIMAALSLKARADAQVQKDKTKLYLTAERILISLVLILAISLHFLGATSDTVWKWNEQPADIDSHPERLWDWEHPQFLPAPEDSFRFAISNCRLLRF